MNFINIYTRYIYICIYIYKYFIQKQSRNEITNTKEMKSLSRQKLENSKVATVQDYGQGEKKVRFDQLLETSRWTWQLCILRHNDNRRP
jgi:hypothetical protein